MAYSAGLPSLSWRCCMPVRFFRNLSSPSWSSAEERKKKQVVEVQIKVTSMEREIKQGDKKWQKRRRFKCPKPWRHFSGLLGCIKHLDFGHFWHPKLLAVQQLQIRTKLQFLLDANTVQVSDSSLLSWTKMLHTDAFCSVEHMETSTGIDVYHVGSCDSHEPNAIFHAL